MIQISSIADLLKLSPITAFAAMGMEYIQDRRGVVGWHLRHPVTGIKVIIGSSAFIKDGDVTWFDRGSVLYMDPHHTLFMQMVVGRGVNRDDLNLGVCVSNLLMNKRWFKGEKKRDPSGSGVIDYHLDDRPRKVHPHQFFHVEVLLRHGLVKRSVLASEPNLMFKMERLKSWDQELYNESA